MRYHHISYCIEICIMHCIYSINISFMTYFIFSFLSFFSKLNDKSFQNAYWLRRITRSSSKKNKGGRPFNDIWEDIDRGKSIGSGKFAASCKYCNTQWTWGEISKLEEHLSNHCQGAPAAVVRKYMTRVIERQDKLSKKRKASECDQWNIDEYHDYTELPESRITRINHALVKFFIACRISFRVVEHPFFINFIKELNAGYKLPTRETLSIQLLERELAQVNTRIKSKIEKETNLTLGLLNYIY